MNTINEPKVQDMGSSSMDDVPILLAEDNPDDVAILKRAFRKAGLKNPITVAKNGEAAIELLKEGAGLPLFVFLDLQMPRFSGFEVLQWIRQQPGLRRLPIVVWTHSEEKSDINRAFHLGANAYWVKPSSFHGLVKILELIKRVISRIDQTLDSPLAQPAA
ncbi:MAG: response regulator [Verrucomicrobiota bacterium]|jgi:CheY-like chemotaxis protein